MIRSACLTAVLIAVWASFACAQTFPHHDLTLEIYPSQGKAEGIDRLRLTPAESPVRLSLAPGTEISEVSLNGKPATFRMTSGQLVIPLPTADHDQEIHLEVRFSNRFDDPVPQVPINTEDPTYGVAATITEEGTFLGGGTGWYPEIMADRETFRIKLVAPKGYLAVTSGGLVSIASEDGKTISIWETQTPLPSLTLSAGPYQKQLEKAGEIPVYTFFYARSQDLARTYLESTLDYMKLYQDLFGPYPFEKFAVVENFFPTGYGFPSWTLLGSAVVRLPFIVETSLGHEIAHSWWGTGVRVDYRDGNWSEGLTTYVADYLYKERSSAEEARDYRLKILRDYASLVTESNDYPLSQFMRRDSKPSQAIGYGKSAMVFHMARRAVGDEAFWSALRKIAEEHMFEQIAWSDFAQALGEVGGKNMKPFFDQWIKREGAPKISLAEVDTRMTDEGFRITGTLRQTKPVYALSIPVRVETLEGTSETMVYMNSRHTQFALTTAAPPELLRVDPDAHVFRRLHSEEIPATVNSVRGAEDLTVVIAENLDPQIEKASLDLLVAMNRRNVKTISEKQLAEQSMKGDLLFLGLPSSPVAAAPLLNQPQINVRESGFTLKGEYYSGPEAVLFAAVSPRQASESTWSYFVPYSAEAARVAARKIPHYGKYSYLAFDNGRNQEKGIWEISHSPLIYEFKQSEVNQ